MSYVLLQSTDGRKAQPGLDAEATAVLKEGFQNVSVIYSFCKTDKASMYEFKYIDFFVKNTKIVLYFF